MTRFPKLALTAAATVAVLPLATTGFSMLPLLPAATTTSTTQRPTTQLALFGGLNDAFKNDESLGKRENAGLKNGPKFNDNVTVNGVPVPGAVPGQKITAVAMKARVKIPVNCQQGDCGTCMAKVNGRKVKACQQTLGSGKTTIQTL